MATGGDSGNIAKKNISGLVTCSLCLEYFQKPKLLPCGHSVCQECLQVYVDKTLNNGTFLCPLCRSSIPLPKRGASGFTHNFLIVRLQDEYNKVPDNRSCDPCSYAWENSTATSKCVECCEYLCDDCTNFHRKASCSRNHHIARIGVAIDDRAGAKDLSRLATIKCPSHQEEVVRYYCLPCHMLICRDCKVLDHTDHKAITFEEAIKGKREDIQRDLTTFQHNAVELSAIANVISQNISTLESEKTSLIKSIGNKRDRLIQTITQAANKAIKHAKRAISGEIKIQKTELDKTQLLKTQHEGNISYTDVLLSNGSDVEVLHGYNLIKERKSNLASESVNAPDFRIPVLKSTQDSLINPDMETYFTLTLQAKATLQQSTLSSQVGRTANVMTIGRRIESLKDLGTILIPEGIYARGLTLQNGKDMFVCVSGNLYRLDGETWTDISSVYCTQGSAVDVCLTNKTLVVSKKSSNIAASKTVQLIQGDITSTRRSTITLPFVSSDRPYVVCGLPLDGQPTYYVTEWTSKPAIHHVDYRGKILQTYGKGELKAPNGIAVNVNDNYNLVVADCALDDVIIYNRDGTVKRRLRQRNNLSKDQLSRPCSVCVDEDGYMFVSSYYTHSVLLFSSNGDYIRTVLAAKDGMTYPHRMSISQHGHLAVFTFVGGSWNIKLYSYVELA